jgi:2-polyprenyl-6-hydroxyphenyl methylase/3-demethylubiquinone-9 3-methyltransferase
MGGAEVAMTDEGHAAGPSVDAEEVARFSRLAADWWNPRGSMRALHRLNPLRLAYLRERIAERFGRSAVDLDGLAGLDVVDIGCGAGLLSEPLARLGARVIGVDAAAENVAVARHHAEQAGVTLDYRCATAETLEAEGARFDVVLAMEVIEHVEGPEAFVGTCARLLRPGGLLVISTINRTLRAYALAIVGAEYVLGWLPRGTHRFEKFVRPEEIEAAARAAGLDRLDLTGVAYDPLADQWRQSRDVAVNYMIAFGG